jgi:hypothetical protein
MALFVVLAEHLAIRVRQAGERDLVALEVGAGVLQGVRRDRDDPGAAIFELRDPVPQLREMLAAERSAKAAQEDEDDGLSAQAG